MPDQPKLQLTASERRASVALAGLFACRMLGLFLLLPVFAVAAQGLAGGDNPAKVGLALGIYGLTQAFMQIPFGLASDRWGRRPVVLFGLLLFIAGSVVCAMADDIFWVTMGRALQGAGAISAAVTAWLADATRDEVRTRAMALVGGSIGLSFALSLVLSPVLVGWWGLSGLFWTIAALGVVCLGVTRFVVPVVPITMARSMRVAAQAPAPQDDLRAEVLAEQAAAGNIGNIGNIGNMGNMGDRGDMAHARPSGWDVLRHTDLLRLNFGVFVLHLVQVSLFVVVPALLAQLGGLDAQHLWRVYLPVILISFVLMVPVIFLAEKKRAHRGVLRAAVAGLVIVLAAMVWARVAFYPMAAALTLFFVMFNVLEALQPSLVSRVAPASYRGLALGFYNTAQAAGLFTGGALGGWLLLHGGPDRVFMFTAALSLVWLAVTWALRPPPLRHTASAESV